MVPNPLGAGRKKVQRICSTGKFADVRGFLPCNEDSFVDGKQGKDLQRSVLLGWQGPGRSPRFSTRTMGMLDELVTGICKNTRTKPPSMSSLWAAACNHDWPHNWDHLHSSQLCFEYVRKMNLDTERNSLNSGNL